MQTRPGLADELAARARLPRERAQEILDTLVRIDAAPVEADPVVELIERAERHPLGLDFLANGHVESVAITFGTHAFRVEEARSHLARRPPAR
jgi:hypothetical protein